MIGIYIIENIINGKKYIGQSWRIDARIFSHIINEQNRHLLYAINKYSIKNFRFGVLKVFSSQFISQSLLDDYESYFISLFDSVNPELGYNLEYGGSKGIPSLSTRKLMSNAKIGIKRPPYKDRSKAVIITAADTGRSFEFPSIVAASRELSQSIGHNISECAIRDVVKGRSKTIITPKGRLTAKFKE